MLVLVGRVGLRRKGRVTRLEMVCHCRDETIIDECPEFLGENFSEGRIAIHSARYTR